MTIVDTDWQEQRSRDSHIPTDVTFVIDGEANLEKVIAAHKLLLAGSSPVFRKLFFGPMKNNSAEVEIKDTTFEAFSTMINFIYEKPNTFSLINITCPQQLCEILNISERYQVTGLSNMTEKALNNFKITPVNMMFTAATSKNYVVFDEVSKMLYRKCQFFLFDTLKTAQDVYSFMLDTDNNFPEANPKLLHELLRANAEKCQNCFKAKLACMDKKILANYVGILEPGCIEAIRVGLRIKQNHIQNSTTSKVTELCYKAHGRNHYTKLSTFVGSNYRVETMFLRLCHTADTANTLSEVRMTIDYNLYCLSDCTSEPGWLNIRLQ